MIFQIPMNAKRCLKSGTAVVSTPRSRQDWPMLVFFHRQNLQGRAFTLVLISDFQTCQILSFCLHVPVKTVWKMLLMAFYGSTVERARRNTSCRLGRPRDSSTKGNLLYTTLSNIFSLVSKRQIGGRTSNLCLFHYVKYSLHHAHFKCAYVPWGSDFSSQLVGFIQNSVQSHFGYPRVRKDVLLTRWPRSPSSCCGKRSAIILNKCRRHVT